MATKTFEELKQLAIQIRDEKTNKQNTATRIGTQMLEHLNKLEQDYYDKTATDEELKQRDEKLTELSSKLRIDLENILNTHIFLAKTGYYRYDGGYTEAENAKSTELIEIGSYDSLSYSTNLNESGCAVSFFDGNKTFIDSLKVLGVSGGRTEGVINLSEDTYQNAKYVALSTYNYFDSFEAKLYNSNSIENRVENLNSEVVNIKNDLTSFEIKLAKTGYYRYDGGYTEAENAKSTELIEIGSYDSLSYSTNLNESGCAVSFFDGNKTFIDSLKVLGVSGGRTEGVINLSEDTYQNAKYVALSTYNYFDSFEAKLYNSNSIENRVNELETKVNNIKVSGSNNNYYKNISIGNIRYQQPTKDINHCIIYGQSLSTGQQTCPPVSTSNFRGNLMAGDYEWISNTGSNTLSVFKNLVARPLTSVDYIPTGTDDQTNGETSAIGMSNSAKHLFDRYIAQVVDRKFMASSCGKGGVSIELLSKNAPNGSQLYSNMITALNSIKTLSNDNSKSICCTAIMWIQGEWNSSTHENMGWFPNTYSTYDKDVYKAFLVGGTVIVNDSTDTPQTVVANGICNDMSNDIKDIYQQDEVPIFMCTQHSTSFLKHRNIPVQMAFVEASNEGKITLVSPTYRVTDRGGHLDANGSRWLGELFAKVWYKKVILGEKWEPLHPIYIKRENNAIYVKFHVPCPPIVFDTNQVRKSNWMGFAVRKMEDDSLISIKTVEIVDSDVVKLTFNSSDLIQGDINISYAGYNMNYGNLRDSDPWKALTNYVDLDTLIENPDGVSYRPTFEPKDDSKQVIYNKPYPCQNFCVQFYYELKDGVNELEIS